jgi:site-specific DNA-methyltransferase (adenine-specific)
MSRIEHIGDATLYLGDCRDILPTLGKVDAVVTSPPYDGLRTYNGLQKPEDFLDVIGLLAAGLTNGGVMMWNVADATVQGSETGTSFRQALHAMSCGLNLHDTMIYIRENVNFPEAVRYFSGHEYMFVFSNGQPKTFNPIKDRRNKWAGTTMHGTDRQVDGSLKKISGAGKEILPSGMRFNYWLMSNNSGDTGHPAPMPYSMAHDHAVTWTNPGDIILDPFMGSGTTGVACANLGRSFIGIEREPAYFDIACRRIARAYEQPWLFDEPVVKPVQPSLLGEAT